MVTKTIWALLCTFNCDRRELTHHHRCPIMRAGNHQCGRTRVGFIPGVMWCPDVCAHPKLCEAFCLFWAVAALSALCGSGWGAFHPPIHAPPTLPRSFHPLHISPPHVTFSSSQAFRRRHALKFWRRYIHTILSERSEQNECSRFISIRWELVGSAGGPMTGMGPEPEPTDINRNEEDGRLVGCKDG